MYYESHTCVIHLKVWSGDSLFGFPGFPSQATNENDAGLAPAVEAAEDAEDDGPEPPSKRLRGLAINCPRPEPELQRGSQPQSQSQPESEACAQECVLRRGAPCSAVGLVRSVMVYVGGPGWHSVVRVRTYDQLFQKRLRIEGGVVEDSGWWRVGQTDPRTPWECRLPASSPYTPPCGVHFLFFFELVTEVPPSVQ